MPNITELWAHPFTPYVLAAAALIWWGWPKIKGRLPDWSVIVATARSWAIPGALIVAAVFGWISNQGGPQPGPRPTPPGPVPVVPAEYDTAVQFAAVVRGDRAKGDAAYLRDVFAAIAERLAADSTVILTRTQIGKLMSNTGAIATAGKTKGRYPGLPGIVGGLFDRHFPKQPGKLTATDRALAVTLFRALSEGAGSVAR